MRSVMDQDFGRVKFEKLPRTTFDRTHGHKTCFNAGDLIPVLVDEIYPGDTFKVSTHALARLNTPIFPLMDNMHLDVHYFFAPMRHLWNNWHKFMGEQEDPGDSIDFTIPQVTAPTGGWVEDTIYDYMGCPIGAEIDVNALPFRAYDWIYDSWFRDQNLDQDRHDHKTDGPDASTSYELLQRKKRHDYFTACLPWPQKTDGTSEVQLPLGTEAPVLGIGKDTTNWNHTNELAYESDGGSSTYGYAGKLNDSGHNANNIFWIEADDDSTPNNPYIRADLTNATAATINELRQAFQVQRLLERDARGGTRYPEIIRSQFGVMDPSWYLLHRPQYLGSSSTPINMTPIAQTSATDAAVSPQGNLAAMGSGVLNGGGFLQSFTEHGYLIGIASVRSDLTYQQGLERMWSRSTRYDFFYPVLQNIGEQAVLNKEIYAQGTSADDEVFGYQERYAELRYKPSRISSNMRSSHSASLDAWHLSQEFSSLPTLNSTFMQENPPLDRVVAVPSEPDFTCDFLFDMKCTRPMAAYSIPGMIDHF